MKITASDNMRFLLLIREFFKHDQIYEMKKYVQHGNTDTLTHCITVAYYSYYLALLLPVHYDIKSIVRGAILHDFYLYDWHIPDKRHRLHGYVHPKFALDNARKYFQLNSIEEDIISRHMWPLTLWKVPRYKESMLVCIVDKLCSLTEILYISMLPKKLLPKLTEA